MKGVNEISGWIKALFFGTECISLVLFFIYYIYLLLFCFLNWHL